MKMGAVWRSWVRVKVERIGMDEGELAMIDERPRVGLSGSAVGGGRRKGIEVEVVGDELPSKGRGCFRGLAFEEDEVEAS